MATEFSLEEAQERLSELLDRAEAGEDIAITRFGAPSVTLTPTRRRSPSSGVAPVVFGGIFAAQVVGDGGDSFDVGTDFWSGDGVSG
jgi:prevent-host-death family protein